MLVLLQGGGSGSRALKSVCELYKSALLLPRSLPGQC